MKIIEPSFSFETPINGQYGASMLALLESAARTCYKSETHALKGGAPEFVRRLVQVRKHESVIEHVSVGVRFIVDRGVSHEIVRHRLAAFSQESTRYCNYSAAKFGHEITVINPPFWKPDDLATSPLYMQWKLSCETAERHYFALIDLGATPQQARSVLPNSLKTELVMTANLREWRHVLRIRTSEAAHPQMQQVMAPLLVEFKTHLACLFDDLP